MELFTPEIREKLIKNALKRKSLKESGREEPDFRPVVNVRPVNWHGSCLITDIDLLNEHVFYGLHDLEEDKIFKGFFNLPELLVNLEKSGLEMECKTKIHTNLTINEYEEIARKLGRIVTC